MSGSFAIMDQHLHEERVARAEGRVVLSRLERGGSLIGARAASLKLVLEGEESYRIDGRTMILQPGQFGYFEAGPNFEEFNRSKAIGFCVSLPRSPCPGEEPFQGLLLGRAIVLPVRTSRLGQLLLENARQLARQPELGEQIANKLLPSILPLVFAASGDSWSAAQQLAAIKASTRRELYHRLERARAYLHSNSDRSVPLIEVARFAGLSQFHLARYFKMAFGRTIIAYHRANRLVRAAGLIKHGCTVAEAAERVGYSDAPSLTHAFTREFGRPPRSSTQTDWSAAA